MKSKKRKQNEIVIGNIKGSKKTSYNTIQIFSKEDRYKFFLETVINSVKTCISEYNYCPTYKDWLKVQNKNKNEFILTEEEFDSCKIAAILQISKELEDFYNKNKDKFVHPSLKIVK